MMVEEQGNLRVYALEAAKSLEIRKIKKKYRDKEKEFRELEGIVTHLQDENDTLKHKYATLLKKNVRLHICLSDS